jgi:putative sterol carrier protein
MAAFTDPDEVYRCLGGMFSAAVAIDDFAATARETGLVVRLIVTEPDCEMIIDFPAGKVLTGPAADGLDSTVQLTMSGDNSNKFWQGKLNFTMAMAQRKVKMEGNRAAALKLLPLTGSLFEIYRETLKAEGREDLLLA